MKYLTEVFFFILASDLEGEVVYRKSLLATHDGPRHLIYGSGELKTKETATFMIGALVLK